MNDILIQIAKKAVDEWKGDQAYHQASELIYLLITEIEKQYTPSTNPPLTLDELREMDGEPVWVSGEESYAIVTTDKNEPRASPVYVRGARSKETFGVAYYELDVALWGLKCYRHKPEREDTK